MAEGNGGSEEFLNAEQYPRKKVRMGGFLKFVVGLLAPEHVDPIELQQMREMPGVDTNLVEKNGKKYVEVSVNSVVIPDDKVKGKKQKPPLPDGPMPPLPPLDR